MTQYFGGACCVSLSEQRLLARLLGHCYSCLRFRLYWLGAASSNPLREQARPSLGQGERPGWARCRRSSLRPRLVCPLPSKALDSFCRVPSCVLTSRPSLASKRDCSFAASVGSSAFGPLRKGGPVRPQRTVIQVSGGLPIAKLEKLAPSARRRAWSHLLSQDSLGARVVQGHVLGQFLRGSRAACSPALLP